MEVGVRTKWCRNLITLPFAHASKIHNMKHTRKALGLAFITTYITLMYVITKDISIPPYETPHSHILFRQFMFSIDVSAVKTIPLPELESTPVRDKSLFVEAMSLKYGLPVNRSSNYTHENFKSMGKERKFCYEQLVEVYGRPKQELCHAPPYAGPRIFCQKSFNSRMMDLCTIDHVIIQDGGMLRLNTNITYCKPLRGPRFADIRTNFVRALVQHAATKNPVNPWCNETVNIGYFYVINNIHIYFKVLGYYSIFETLLRNNHKLSEVRFYRTEELRNWPNQFADFERVLFGRVAKFTAAEGVCFNKVIFVPDGYSTNPFRCKMSGESMVFECRKCNGNKMPYHAIHLFKQYVLAKCGITGRRHRGQDAMNITLILRKPYQRFSNDRLEHFSRVLLNTNQVVDQLRNISSARVLPVYMETLDFCEQVRLAWYSDVLIGVHGSGLVHLWWIDDFAEAIEVEPHGQRGNPTFRTLSTLTHTRYARYTIEEYKDTHVALGTDFIKFVRNRIEILKTNLLKRSTYSGIQISYEGIAPLENEIVLDDSDTNS